MKLSLVCHTLKTMTPTEEGATVSKGRVCYGKVKNWTSTTWEVKHRVYLARHGIQYNAYR